jgi:hypothetical protein
MGIHEVVTAPHAPWQTAYVERLIGSSRRECLDHVIVLHIDTNDARPDLSLDLVTRSSAQIGVGLGTRVTMDHPDGRATP